MMGHNNESEDLCQNIIELDESDKTTVTEKKVKTKENQNGTEEKAKNKNKEQLNKLKFNSSLKQKESDAEKFDEVDYVKCERCNLKILCWEMPEHEDYHFAKELSRQFAPNAIDTSTAGKKRSIDEIATKSEENVHAQKTILTSKNKKVKSNNSTETGQKNKSIGQFFKKLN